LLGQGASVAEAGVAAGVCGAGAGVEVWLAGLQAPRDNRPMAAAVNLKENGDDICMSPWQLNTARKFNQTG
jgi:hypothetical protein